MLKRRVVQVSKMLAVAAAAGMLASEVVLRLGFGLADPPLSTRHPDIEYMFVPNQDVTRFGNRIRINAYGMRSKSFPREPRSGEIRIMVFGDSVINGGAPTDQSELATERLQARLDDEANGPVVVGNISAGSWGPGNWLAYAEEYGFFNADHVVLVLSGHDASDTPTFAPLDPLTHPTEKPWSAVGEAVTRYAIPRIFGTTSSVTSGNKPSGEPRRDGLEDEAKRQAMTDLERFIGLAQASASAVTVFYHPERKEFAGEPRPEKGELKALVESADAEFVDLQKWYRGVEASAGVLYRDGIHPSPEGQAALARAMIEYFEGGTSSR